VEGLVFSRCGRRGATGGGAGQKRSVAVGAMRPIPVFGIVRPEVQTMQKSTSFSLGDHFSSFIEAQVAEGRYASASDVVRAALRLLEEQEAQLAALRAALVEGEQSGEPTEFDFEAFIAAKRASR
jgi:antitoxin ParD1/3/4